MPGTAPATDGSEGFDVSTLEKLKALVMSPTFARRHAERFGTSAPKRVSRKRRIDVWSNCPDATNPPRLKGEIINIGTRNPSPIGPLIAGLPIDDASDTAVAVTNSPGVPAGAVGGVT